MMYKDAVRDEGLPRRRAGCAALITNESNAVLMILKKTGPEPNCWDLPGGGQRPEETPRQALVREVREEVGLEYSRDYGEEHLVGTVDEYFPEWKGGMRSATTVFRYRATKGPEAREGDQAEVGKVAWITPDEAPMWKLTGRTRKALALAGLIES